MLVDGDEPARFDQVTTKRAVIFTGGQPVRLPDHRDGWRWEPYAVDGADVEAARQQLQRLMRDAEADIAEALSNDGWLTVLDGPLHGIRHRRGLPVIGYVKTHHRRMLAREHWVRVPDTAKDDRHDRRRGGHIGVVAFGGLGPVDQTARRVATPRRGSPGVRPRTRGLARPDARWRLSTVVLDPCDRGREVDRVGDASGPQGVALQVQRLRHPGRLLAPGEFVPPAVVDFIGRQLDLDGDDLADYAVRSETGSRPSRGAAPRTGYMRDGDGDGVVCE